MGFGTILTFTLQVYDPAFVRGGSDEMLDFAVDDLPFIEQRSWLLDGPIFFLLRLLNGLRRAGEE